MDDLGVNSDKEIQREGHKGEVLFYLYSGAARNSTSRHRGLVLPLDLTGLVRRVNAMKEKHYLPTAQMKQEI